MSDPTQFMTFQIDAAYQAPQASHLDTDAGWSDGAFSAGRTDSGERVSPTTALSHGPV